MTILSVLSGGVAVTGGGSDDYLCGRCGRLLGHRVAPHSFQNFWIKCPRCDWINGIDIDLSLARYVVDQLTQAQVPLQRLEQMLEDAANTKLSDDEFEARNPELPAMSILRRVSVQTVVAILTLIYSVYVGQKTIDIAEESRDIASQALRLQQQGTASFSEEDVVRIARELRRLQEQSAVKAPPRPPRKQRRAQRRHR